MGGWGKQAPTKTKEELRTKLGSEVPFKQPVAYILERNRNDEGEMSIVFGLFHSFCRQLYRYTAVHCNVQVQGATLRLKLLRKPLAKNARNTCDPPSNRQNTERIFLRS